MTRRLTYAQEKNQKLCNLPFDCADKRSKCDLSIASCSEVLSCSIVCKLFSIQCVDEILKYGHTNESCVTILSQGILDYAVQGGS